MAIRTDRFKTVTASLLLALGYFATGRLGLMLPAFGSSITLIWLPTGIAVAMLLRWGSGCWPGIAVGAFAVNLAVGTPWQVDLAISAGNTLGPLLAVWVLRRTTFHPAFDRARDILLLAAGGALGMMVTSGVGIAALTGAGLLPSGTRSAAWLTWWAGDVLGVIAAAPLILTFTPESVRVIRRRWVEFLIWIGTTCLTTWAVFVANRGESGQALALAFIPLPFVAWAALRFGPVGTSLGLIVLSVGAAYGTATLRGPFYRTDAMEEVMLLWLYMATSAVLGWLISALNRARVQATGVQRLLEQALSDVSLGVLLAGLDRRITYANQGFTRLTGYTEEELMGRSCALLQGPETDRATAERLKTAVFGDGFFDGEILNYRKDGTTFWNGLLISPVRDERGTMTGYLGIQRDISKRKQAEMALHHSEEHLRTIIELEPECVKLLSPEGALLEMNPAGLAMIEADSIEDVRGTPVEGLIEPEDRAVFAEMNRRVLEGATGHCEFAIVGLKGTRRWLETHAVPYRNPQRKIVGILGITRDITARREAAAEIERSLSTLQLFINSVPAYISFVDAEERYRLVNRRYEEYFGQPAANLIGKRLIEVQPQAAYAEMQPHVRAALAGKTVRYQSNPTGPDGRSYWLDVQYVPRRSEDGAVSGFFVLVFDITESKQSEIALRESRSRLDGILNCLEEVVYSTSLDGSATLFISASAENLFGRPAADFMANSKLWFELIHPNDQLGVERAIQGLRETGSCEAEYRILREDGTVRWVHSRTAIVRDEHGRPLRIDGIAMDVTHRKEAESALREREEQFRTLADNLPDVVARFDRERRHLYVNAAVESATGFKPEEFVGRTNEDLGMSSENTAAWKATLERVFSTGCSERIEFSYPSPNGTSFWESLLVAERAANGNIESALVLSRDITERKRLEQEREQYFRFFQLSNDPMCIADPFGCFKRVNPAFLRLTGFSEDELLTKPFLDFVLPEDREKTVEEMKLQVGVRPSMQFENRYVCKDGAVILLSWMAYFDKNDGVTYATARDITKSRQAQLEREQLDRKVQETQKLESLGVLAGGIAHDFNNLLTSILGNASIAAMELPPGSSVQDCIEQINEASLRAADLCKQMLAYSGRGRFVVQKLDLGQLVEQTAQMLQISISKKAILRFRLEKGLPPVEVDATQIRQVIMNLVINASEAIGDQSGVISISTGLTRIDRHYLHGTLMDPNLPEGDYVFLEVSDSGCGMSADTQARIFDPFFTTKFTGRGLGLAAVLGIVRGHKGAMKVYSEVGRGTTFKLLFPAAAGASEVAAIRPAVAPGWLGGGTVLVVDDEETMRSIIARMMRKVGLEPVLVADGREAIEVFRASPGKFALVLLDLTMPHMDGEQTFTELRRLQPDVRVVLMSGFNAHEALLRFSGKGLASFLQKPFTIDALSTTMQEVLNGKEPTEPDRLASQ